jgi:hypothetical protein
MENDISGASRPPARRRHWKHIHHSKLFWVGIVLVLAAIAIYVLSEDLSWRLGVPGPTGEKGGPDAQIESS